ncbi:flagellar biosynthetic protein [Buchnera aphidicola (Nipponaphis monzeni)]|uniref:Flagellar biosynthetic protein FlhB n=1 Tax=Buchnera aphidicola (Nipponaphis monzeni) TaxID=2495405 RepID=A0A455TA42_9GAMM|nr:EscU/YscU/HrcU family type III secretion system export apparatus switch protein [Buchnera aphidicola]BBI01204.1 flagellar biosynthetic protein [Buchnera aphidicola (Nipponaphis monzeni)]
MLSNHSGEDKTEEPSHYRLKQAHQEGKKKYSKELHFFLVFLINIFFLWFFSKSIFLYFLKLITQGLNFNYFFIIQENNLFLYLNDLVKNGLTYILIFEFFCVLFVLIFLMLLNHTIFSIKRLKFSYTNLNFLNGIKKIFSLSVWLELFKKFLNVCIIFLLFMWYINVNFYEIMQLSLKKPFCSLYIGYNIFFTSILVGMLGLLPALIFDIFWQYNQYYKELKMTHHEVKEEFKQFEGDPNIKRRIRELMKSKIYSKMLYNVNKSHVIVTNPIHYAIALQYDAKKMIAPKVLEKAKGYLALKMCEVAKKKLIPIFQSPLLARKLYQKSAIGEFISEDLYIAIAEILAWVWKIKRWREKGGVYPDKPQNL